MLALLLCRRAFSFSPSARRARSERINKVLCASGNLYDDTDTDPVIQLPLMEAELDTIINNEDQNKDDSDFEIGGLSTQLHRDVLQEKINDVKTAAEFGVRRAQVEFYDAFSNQDIELMDKVWSDDNNEETSVRCVHPGMEAISGKDAIMKSWSRVFQGGAFDIEPDRVKIEICGKTAMCSCIEQTPNGGKLEALNIYQREGGKWRMTLHIASPIIMSAM